MKNFNLKAFETLPQNLKPSDYVDILLFLAHEKPCIRLGYNHQSVYQNMLAWCKENKLASIVSEAGFMYISKNFFLALIAKIADDSTLNHAYIFGKILGYPTCCSRRIAEIGESKIDEYEKELVSNSDFQEPYNKIDPKGYIEGYSLISHIPCCETCRKSLEKANSTYEVILKYKEHPSFEKWRIHWF